MSVIWTPLPPAEGRWADNSGSKGVQNPIVQFAPAQADEEEEVVGLKKQAEFFETALGNIRKRLEELETQPKTE